MKKIYKIEALDIADYNEHELIDIYITDEELTREEAVKEWAEKNGESWSCFIAKEVDEDNLQRERDYFLKEIERLKEKKELLNNKLSEV